MRAAGTSPWMMHYGLTAMGFQVPASKQLGRAPSCVLGAGHARLASSYDIKTPGHLPAIGTAAAAVSLELVRF